MAVLVRTRSAYPKIFAALASHNIPVQPEDRSGLFSQPEALAPAR